MVIASRRSGTSKAAAVIARGLFGLSTAFSALMLLAMPATAWGDIYKWTDEQGRINISNVPPPTSGKAKDVALLVKEARPTSIPQHAATPTEQALIARIDSLERQLQAQQYAAQAPAAPPPAPYGNYYPQTPAPPPPQTSYYESGYGRGYYSSYYPSYYPAYYYPVASSYVVYPARTFVRGPGFGVPHGGVSRGGFSHGGGGHRGRR